MSLNNLLPRSKPSFAFGLIAYLESTRISLPLKGVECRFSVVGDVVTVELDQIYHQSANKPLDCLYTFPLPAGAAVYRCEMHVNGRVIAAKVQEEAAARQMYEEKKAEGMRVAMVNEVRENVFTLNLGNVQPEDLVVIRLAYVQTLARLGAEMSLQIPVCPGVRYISGQPLLRSNKGHGTVDDTDQVPDASLITPPRMSAFHPDAAYFALSGTITRGVAEPASLVSPTHPIDLRLGDAVDRVELRDHGAVPDRDFVIRWQEPESNALTPLAWACQEGEETYALLQLRAPASAAQVENWEQDVYFPVDRSGSMEGAKWQKTCQALHAFVRLLGRGDRVWITLFESISHDFAEKPLPAAIMAQDPEFRRLEKMGVSGGTEMLRGFRKVLKAVTKHSPDRRASIVLITDGEVGNEQEILEELAAAGPLPVHVFGIDTTVNDAFLKNIARQQGGECVFRTPGDDIAAAVAKLGDRLRRPVLVDLALEDGWEPAGGTLPNLFGGQILDLPLRRRGALCPITLQATPPDGEEAQTFKYDPVLTQTEGCRLLWVRERIETLLTTHREAEAIELAVRNNVLCKGATFIAWDESEKVEVARTMINQPSLEPEMSMADAAAMPVGAMACMVRCDDTFEAESADFCFTPAPAPRRLREKCSFKKTRGLMTSYDGSHLLKIAPRRVVNGHAPLSWAESKFEGLEEGLRKRAVNWYRESKKFWSFLEKDAYRFLAILARWMMEGDHETRLKALEHLLSLFQEVEQQRPPHLKFALAKVGRDFITNHPEIPEAEREAAMRLLQNID